MGPILSEIEFSGVGSRANVALGHTLPLAFAGDEGAFAAATFVRRGMFARMEVTSAVMVTALRGTIARTEVTSAAHDAASSFSACEPSRDAEMDGISVVCAAASPPSAYGTRCDARTIVAREAALTTSPSYLVAPASLVGDGDLVVAETSSESGSNPTYSLVVRWLLCIVATISWGLSVSPVGNMRIHH